MNNNNPQKNSPFGNSLPTNPTAQFQSQSQPQQQSGSPFASQFQLSQYAQAHAHAQAIAQAQSKAQAQAMAQAQANHAQFQAQLQAQGMSINQPLGHFSGNSPSFPGLANSGIRRMAQKPVGRPPGVSNANTISPMRMM